MAEAEGVRVKQIIGKQLWLWRHQCQPIDMTEPQSFSLACHYGAAFGKASHGFFLFSSPYRRYNKYLFALIFFCDKRICRECLKKLKAQD